jgi:hypothetical protein
MVTLSLFAPLNISCQSSPSCEAFDDRRPANPDQPQVTCNAAGRVKEL